MQLPGFNFNNISLGIDLVDVKRFSNLDMKSRLAKNIFSAQEIKKCEKKRSNAAQCLAARFAAKEAVRKSIKENVRFNKIEIGNNARGAPVIRYLDKKINKKYKSIVSLSHTKDKAQAVCITLTNINQTRI